RARIERFLAGCCHERLEMCARDGEQVVAALRENQATSLTNEELRAHERNEPSHRGAHGRLRHVKTPRRSRHASFFRHDDEHAKEIEIEIPRINIVHVVHHYYSLAFYDVGSSFVGERKVVMTIALITGSSRGLGK